MGNNNLCYSKGGMESQMSQLICQTTFRDCNIYLTAGQIEKEQVECIVLPTDTSFSNVRESDKPTFIPQLGQCIFVASQKKSKKNYILAVVQENDVLSFQDKQDEERQIIYETIQNSLKMANSRQMKSIGFPVFSSKDNTTSATIMIMAIKFFIADQKTDTVNSIYLTLNQVNQVSSFKWVFQQGFELNSPSKSKSYSSTINPTFQEEFKSIRLLYQQQQSIKDDIP